MKTGVALGSNLGDRLANLRVGRDFLLTLHQGAMSALISSAYETDPMDCAPGTPPFLNAVVEIQTFFDLTILWEKLREQERRLGRDDAPLRNRPRPLDLDILYMGNLQICEGPVLLPHPRASQRRFVMQPLADLHPHLILPGHVESVEQQLSRLPLLPAVRLWRRDW